MQIDWITVAAQIINFLVLAWLLHRFLYGPITKAMERRAQRIAQRLSEADQKREEAVDEARAFQTRQKELEDRREQFLNDAREEAAKERNRLFEQAQDDIALQKKSWQEDVEQQRTEFLHDIRQRTRDHFYALARRALGDLADVHLEEQMIRVFREKLATLDADAKNKLAEAGRKNGNGAIIRSGFEIAADIQNGIRQTVQDSILTEATVTFERDADIICGIELKMGGQTLAWNLDSYFVALERLTEEELGKSSPPADRAPGNG